MLAAAAVVVLATTSGPAPTPDQHWLQWDAPSTCPERGYVEDATTERLGRAPTLAEVEVEVTITDHGSDGLRLKLGTVRDGQRDAHTMTAHDCRALADATALVVALTVDPVAVAGRVDAPPEPEPPPAAPSVEPPAPEPPPEPPADPPVVRRQPARVEAADAAPPPKPAPRVVDAMLRAEGGVELGALPGVTGGPALALAVGLPRLRIELGAMYLAPRRASGADATVNVQLGAATARVCGRLRTRRIEVPLCGGLEAGGMRGDGSGAPDARPAAGLWLAPAVSAGAHGWLTPRLALVARAEVAVPLALPAFEIRDPGDAIELFRPEPVSGRIWIGIEGKLWARGDGSAGSRRSSP
ncbi:MAG: hypothetical protein AAF721_01865 [Myxococcota bacterium]